MVSGGVVLGVRGVLQLVEAQLVGVGFRVGRVDGPGLLPEREVATHWLASDLLESYGSKVSRERNGGIAAGLDPPVPPHPATPNWSPPT